MRRGEVKYQNSFFLYLDFFKSKTKKILGVGTFFLGTISLGRVVITSPKIVKTIPIPKKSYLVKENPISLAVSEILRNKQTNTQTHTSCYVIIRINSAAT